MKNLLVALAACGIAVSIACSTTTTPGTTSGGNPADAAIEEDTSVPVILKDAGKDAPATQTLEECLAKCDKDHPTGLVKDKAIDTCWTTRCAGPCVGEADGGTTTSDAGACKNDVDTGDVECDACTVAACCAEWDGCFDDADCSALQDCRLACEE